MEQFLPTWPGLEPTTVMQAELSNCLLRPYLAKLMGFFDEFIASRQQARELPQLHPHNPAQSHMVLEDFLIMCPNFMAAKELSRSPTPLSRLVPSGR